MAEEVGSAAGKAARTVALKAFINPNIDIVKAIPQGIIELSLRGAAVVSAYIATKTQQTCIGTRVKPECLLLLVYKQPLVFTRQLSSDSY